jgi:hypothetical protein
MWCERVRRNGREPSGTLGVYAPMTAPVREHETVPSREDYLSFAARCDALALKAATPKERREYEARATIWRHLALARLPGHMASNHFPVRKSSRYA